MTPFAILDLGDTRFQSPGGPDVLAEAGVERAGVTALVMPPVPPGAVRRLERALALCG